MMDRVRGPIEWRFRAVEDDGTRRVGVLRAVEKLNCFAGCVYTGESIYRIRELFTRTNPACVEEWEEVDVRHLPSLSDSIEYPALFAIRIK